MGEIILIKKRYLFLIIFVCLFAVSTVSASENIDETQLLTADNGDEISSVNNNEILSVTEGTYSELITEIGSGGNITLNKDFYRYDSGDTINISQPGTIDGNGAIIDMMGSKIQVFKINANVTIKNIIFKNTNYNKTGSVIYCWNDYYWGHEYYNVNVDNCKFYNNSASTGGAIYCHDANITNCEFYDNSAEYDGGAIYGYEANIINCEFYDNFAYMNGGAIYSTGSSQIINCEYYNNSVRYSGAAIYCSFGSINNCIFNNNSASYGGAIYAKGCSQIINCIFNNNSASDNGGAICMDYDSYDYTVNNSKFYNNSAVNGGAIFIEEGYGGIFSNLTLINNAAIYGGAIFSKPGAMTTVYIIKDSTFINNFGDYDSSIFISNEGISSHSTMAKILDSYLYSNEKKELIYSKFSPVSPYNYLFLKNNTMISPISYKIYSNLDSISSNKYLIFDNKTCYINKAFPLTYTDDNKNKIRLDTDIIVILTDLKNDHLSFKVNATLNSTDGCYYMYSNQPGIFNVSVNSTNVTCIPSILKVNSLSPDLSINVNNAVYSENTTFIVNVAVDTFPVNEGIISFYIDDKKIGFTNVSNGLATFDYAYPKVGTFSILAIYEENDNYLSSNATALFTVNKMPTVLSAESVIFEEKGPKIFTAELKDNNSNGVSGQNVKLEAIKYSGESRTFNGISDVNGIIEYDVTNLAGGMWYILGTYDGNKNYINSKLSDKFIVIRMDTTTNIEEIVNPQVNHTYKIKANIHDENGKLVKDGIVQFYLDGVYIGSIDLSKHGANNNDVLGASNLIFDYKLGDDEEPYIEYTPTKAGNFKLSAVYEGTTVYKTSNYTTDFIVGEGNKYNLSAPELVKYSHGPERFVVTLTDGDTNPLSGQSLSIMINGATFARTTDDKGQASIAINLYAGFYKVVVRYEDINVTSSVTVLPTVLGSDIVKMYKNGTQYYATFLDSEGKYLTKGTAVSFNLDNYFYSQTIIDNKGTAKLDINNKPGEYIITAMNPVTGENTANSIIVLSTICQNYDLVKYYNESDKFSVVILGPTGNPASGQKVKFTIGDKIYEATTNSNGYAFLNAVLQPGTYIVTTAYGDLEVNNTIKILPTIYDKDMQVSSSDINVGEYEVIMVVLPKDAGGSISTTINNVEYSMMVNKGIANMIIPGLTYGNYNIEVIYSGDSHYNSVRGKTSFVVKKTADLSAPDVTKYYHGPERFVVTLKDLNGKAISDAQIKITINGQTSTRTTDSNGQTSMGINLNSGKYTAEVEYGDVKVNSTVTVKPTISGNNVTKIYRNDTQYYATFLDSNGNLLKNTDVNFNINGVFYTRKTNDQGVAKMNINLLPGEYIITAANLVSSEQYSNVIKVLPSVITYDLTKYYKNASRLTFMLLDNQGRPVGAGVSATININGVFYTRQTNASGYINMNINLNPGTYIATINYNGLMASSTIKVLPILSAKDVVMKYRDGTKFEVKLLDGQGKPFAGQTLILNINGVFYNRVTGSDGIAKLNINLMPGEYIITSMYNGGAISNKITIRSDVNTNTNTANLKSPEEQYFDILGPNGANGYVYYPDGTYEHFVNDIVVDGTHYADKSY